MATYSSHGRLRATPCDIPGRQRTWTLFGFNASGKYVAIADELTESQARAIETWSDKMADSREAERRKAG